MRELLERAKAEPRLADLFTAGCLALARAGEAGRLPQGHRDRAEAVAHLITIQRQLMDATLERP